MDFIISLNNPLSGKCIPPQKTQKIEKVKDSFALVSNKLI